MSAIPTHTSFLSSDTSASHGNLGYGIAITAGILILISAILISSYACRWINRSASHMHAAANHHHPTTPVPPDQSNLCIVVKGLDMHSIESYPKFLYAAAGDESTHSGPLDSVCSICLSDYKPQEMLRRIPECNHCFHAACIDSWLQRKPTCPICRNSPLPTPLATPLSDSVPLAANARW
ncbi:hypothetical protein ACLOJK_000293 [Asimina triloba]